MGQTVPAVFFCREHETEMTAAVIAKIEATGVTVTGGGMRVGPGSRPRPFAVMVKCPRGDGHELMFRGTYRAGG